MQGTEEHQDIPKIFLKIAAIHRRTSSTETMIVPETKQRNESFSFQSLSQ